jgi:hypothetical protein
MAENAKVAYIEKRLHGLARVADIRKIEDLRPGEVLTRSKSCADIIFRNNDGVLKFIEIKATRVQGNGRKCFGAITQSEMECAMERGEDYLFVFMILGPDNAFRIEKSLTASELLENKALTCPPAKYYFNIDPSSEVELVEFRRQETTIVTSVETIDFHSELSSLMNSIAGSDRIIVSESNFLGLVTLLKMGDLKNMNVRIDLYQFMINSNITGILPDSNQEEIRELLQNDFLNLPPSNKAV